MTNNITEAVRRLRGLQEEVERLKGSGVDGELRELRDVENVVAADDTVVVGPDADVEDVVAAVDAAVARLNDVAVTDTAQTSETATVSNIQTATPAVCDFDDADKSNAG